MIKRNFVFTVSLVAMFAVSSAWADAATGDAVGTAHTVYDNTGLNMAESGIAGVTYVNRMVNAAGNSAQKAEAHAASAGAAAISAAADADVAAQAAADANTAAQEAKDTLVNKQDKLIAGTNITIAADGKTISATDTKYSAGSNISLSGTTFNVPTANGTNLGVVKQGSNITIANDGTISATDMRYTLPTASSTIKGGVKIGSGVNVATDGTISVAAPGNATLTIQRNGASVGTFTANASSPETINITDSDTTYTAGSNITISDDNAISVNTTATPTANSTVPLTAGGAYTALGNKQNTLTAGSVAKNLLASGVQASLDKADTAVQPGAISDMQVKSDIQTSFVANLSEADKNKKYTSVGYVESRIGGINTGLGNINNTLLEHADLIEAAQDTADAAVVKAQGDANKNKAVITDANGDITTGTISTGMIADNAVTAAKTSGVIGFIPSGGATASTYAQIWVE